MSAPLRLRLGIPKITGFPALAVTALLGAPLEAIVEDTVQNVGILDGPLDDDGARIRLRLAIPDGLGFGIPLGTYGEIRFMAEEGNLGLTVPWGMALGLRQKLASWILKERRDADGIRFLLRVPTGQVLTFSLPLVGDLTLEGG